MRFLERFGDEEAFNQAWDLTVGSIGRRRRVASGGEHAQLRDAVAGEAGCQTKWTTIRVTLKRPSRVLVVCRFHSCYYSYVVLGLAALMPVQHLLTD